MTQINFLYNGGIKMTKQDILDYVAETPHNTNIAVLSSMLDSYIISDNKEEINLSVTSNNIYTPETGKVYKKVTVNVPVPELIELTITDPTITEYTAPEGKAYSTVTILSDESDS